MSRKFTRRDFLKLSSLAIGAAAFTSLSPTDLGLAAPAASLGRITLNKARVLSRPNRLADTIGYVSRDDVVQVYRSVVGDGFYPHNNVWTEIPQGFVYSSWVQPVKDLPQKPLAALPPDGFFGEVSVPFSDARAKADPAGEIIYRLYYSVVLKIDAVQAAPDGSVWYHVADDQAQNFWADGRHVRVISPDEMSPLSPNVTDKRIVANVKTNWLSAYEGQTEVFRTRIASGATFFEPDGTRQATLTPGGVHRIWSKRVSRHMAGGVAPDGYDLPGVGWVTYFATGGASIHSTYWHNDYGRPRSHGCLNCNPDAAKWLFRWTAPTVAYDPGDITVSWPGGTSVEIEGTPAPLQSDTNG